MLESRDKQYLVDAVVGQRKRADVRRDPLHALDVALGEVDPDQLDPGTEKPGEIDGLGVRVADLDHAPGLDETREGPWNLDDALVRPARRLQPRQPRAACTCTEPQGDRIVELADPRRLGGGDELVQERRARERPIREHAESAGPRLLVGRAAQDLAESALDELLVRPSVRVERRLDRRVHLGVVVEAATRLTPQSAGGDVPAQERARRVLLIAETLVQHLHDRDTRVEPDQVGEGEGA